MKIVDTHVHVWKLASARFPWQPIGKLRPDFQWTVEQQVMTMEQNNGDAPGISHFECAWDPTMLREPFDPGATDGMFFGDLHCGEVILGNAVLNLDLNDKRFADAPRANAFRLCHWVSSQVP